MAGSGSKVLVFSADHGGIDLKNKLVAHAGSLGHTVVDVTRTQGESVDYPDEVGAAVGYFLQGQADFLVLVCGSGVGVSIAANRHHKIRAVLADNPYTAALARAHNHANCLCLGQRLVGEDMACAVLDSFIANQPDLSERHKRRVHKLEEPCRT